MNDPAKTSPEPSTTQPEAVITPLSAVKSQTVRWLWPSRIPLGKLTLIVGDTGMGKSFLTLDIAARVSTGGPWPDGPAADNPLGRPKGRRGGSKSAPGGVVLLSAANDLADTVRPRLGAAVADLSRILAITTVTGACNSGPTGRCTRKEACSGDKSIEPFSLSQHLPALERAIQKMPDCRLVVVDLAELDSLSNRQRRGILASLSDLAARHGLAVVLVTHLRKGQLLAAAHTAYLVTTDRQDSSARRRFFLPTKNNLVKHSGGLAYCLDPSAAPNLPPAVKWESDPVNLSADQALRDRPRPRGQDDEDNDPSELDRVATWLAKVLADGPKSTWDITTHANEERFSRRTVDRAKKRLNISAFKSRGVYGQWYWRLPQSCPDGNPPGKNGDASLFSSRGGTSRNDHKENGEVSPIFAPPDDAEEVIGNRKSKIVNSNLVGDLGVLPEIPQPCPDGDLPDDAEGVIGNRQSKIVNSNLVGALGVLTEIPQKTTNPDAADLGALPQTPQPCPDRDPPDDAEGVIGNRQSKIVNSNLVGALPQTPQPCPNRDLPDDAEGVIGNRQSKIANSNLDGALGVLPEIPQKTTNPDNADGGTSPRRGQSLSPEVRPFCVIRPVPIDMRTIVERYQRRTRHRDA